MGFENLSVSNLPKLANDLERIKAGLLFELDLSQKEKIEIENTLVILYTSGTEKSKEIENLNKLFDENNEKIRNLEIQLKKFIN